MENENQFSASEKSETAKTTFFSIYQIIKVPLFRLEKFIFIFLGMNKLLTRTFNSTTPPAMLKVTAEM